MLKILKINWLFICIVSIQLFVLIFSFAYFKQGFHSDEIYEYGFANSYDLRLPEMDDNGVQLDRKWIDSKELLNYIAVDKNHRFAYSKIFEHASNCYYNPPLKLFVLHTICSFFPGIFSKWFSFCINIISFLVLQIFLYKIIKKITKNIFVSVAGVSLFGFGAGCFNSMMFLRMYIMGMALAIVFLYFSYEYFQENNKKKDIVYLLASFISLFLGAYTLHLFLVYAFPIVVVICISFLILRKLKKFLLYGFSSLGAVVLSFIAFPTSIFNTTQSTEAYSYSAIKYPSSMQFRIYTCLATLDNFGFHTSMYSNLWIKNILAIFLFIFILCIPLFILFRKEIWFVNFLKNIKKRVIITSKKIGCNIVFMISFIITIFFVIYIASIRTSVYFMSTEYASRYLFIIYPLISLFTTLLLYYLCNIIFSSEKISGWIVVFAALFFAFTSQLYTEQSFLMKHEEKDISLNAIEEDANCYILLRSNWFIACFTNELYRTNSYYFVNYNNYKDEEKCFEDLDRNKPLYIIADASVFITEEISKEMDENADSLYNSVYNLILVKEEDVLDHYKSLGDVNDIVCVGEDWIFDRPIKIYRVYFE